MRKKEIERCTISNNSNDNSSDRNNENSNTTMMTTTTTTTINNNENCKAKEVKNTADTALNENAATQTNCKHNDLFTMVRNFILIKILL